MSAGSCPAFFAASCICTTAHEPSHMVPTLPVAMRFLLFSQLVVVGSCSDSPPCTMSYSRVSPAFRSPPAFHGSDPEAKASCAFGSQLTEPTTPVQAVSGQPSL